MHSVFIVNLLGPAVCCLCLEESDGERTYVTCLKLVTVG